MCCLGWRQLSRRPARSTRAALASTLARATVWREAARVLPRVAAAEPSPCSLDAGCTGFYAGARHSVARGGTCAASGGGSWAAVMFARCGLCWLLRWRAPRRGERRHVCCLGWRQLGRRPARSTRAALASTLARATVWREAAHVLPRVAAAGPSPCSLDAGCADFYAGARHGVARGGTCAASGGGSWAAALLARCGLRWLLRWRAPRCGEGRHVCCLGWRQLSRRPARSTRAALASTLARATVWRGAARVLPRVAAAGPSPCSLDAGCAGFYAGARHGVARGGTCAASGGNSWAVALLAQCGLRWLLRWRAPRCGERRHVCCLGWQ